MQRMTLIALLGIGVLACGCATKRYVAQQTDPINSKVGDVDKKVDQNQQTTQKTFEEDERKLNATDEKASSADNRAGDAINRADAASKKADQVKSDLHNELNDRIANLDDYKSAGEATVLFKFNSAKLTDDGKQQLDQLVGASGNSLKRYFVAIQGFTDKVGPADYNLDLSRRRAQAVQTYLIGEKNIPVYRIQIVGLGKDKPVNEQKTRADRSANRRVEVTLFSADGTTAAQNQPSGAAN